MFPFCRPYPLGSCTVEGIPCQGWPDLRGRHRANQGIAIYCCHQRKGKYHIYHESFLIDLQFLLLVAVCIHRELSFNYHIHLTITIIIIIRKMSTNDRSAIKFTKLNVKSHYKF